MNFLQLRILSVGVFLCLLFAYGIMPSKAQSGLDKTNISNSSAIPGYFNHTSIGILPGGSNTSFRFQVVNGYRFSPHFTSGLGTGYVTYNDPLALIPLFIENRIRLSDANVASLVFLNAGYSFSVVADKNMDLESHRGGLMLNPGIGLEIGTGEGFGLQIAAGFNLDNISYEQRRWDGRTVETDIYYRRLQFGVGLTF